MTEVRNSNRALLLRVWASPLLTLGSALLAIVFMLRGGASASTLYPIGGGAVAAVLLVVVLRARLRGQLRRLLQGPDPTALIESARRRIGSARIPSAQLLVASSTAMYRALYGQFGRALDALDEHDWRDAPALYRAAMLQSRALVSYLSRDDVAGGLNAAKEARDLAEVPGLAPGARANQRTAATYVDIGLILTGAADADVAAKLVARLDEIKSPTERAVALWATALAHSRDGHADEAARLLDEIKGLAPHCAPLHDILSTPHGQQAASATAAAALQAMCALHPDAPAAARCVRCGSFACERCARSVSERGAVCSACYARYRELRMEHLPVEASLRAAGLAAQVLGVLCLPPALWLAVWVARTPGTVGLLGMVVYLLFAGGSYFFSGRRLRKLDTGWPRRVLLLSLPALAIVPAGTAAAVYLLWIGYGPAGRRLRALEYESALRLTPDLTPRLPTLRACLALAVVLLNGVLIVALGWS